MSSTHPGDAAAGVRRLGAIKGQPAPRGRQVTVAEFRRMWEDPSLTLADIAASLGICQRAVWQRARHRNLPARGYIVAKARSVFNDEFPAMFAARVHSAAIAAHYGCTVSNVEKHARKIGATRSRPITRWDKGLTLADFRALQLRDAMAASARETAAAMMDAEMIDNRQAARWPQGRAA
jgi:hypothetical protein